MFDFLFHKHRDRVRKLLSRHMNQAYAQRMHAADRAEERGGFCQAVWIIPCAHGEPQFDRAQPGLTRDVSPEGIGLVDRTFHKSGDELVLGMFSKSGGKPEFIRATVQHCTPLGLGFFHIGVHATREEQIGLDTTWRLERRGQALDASYEVHAALGAMAQ